VNEPRPTGMRIQRPYKTEEEYVRGDGLSIGRTGMILINAPAKTPGIIIRFEIVLADGTPVFRGEGKVVAHRVAPNGKKGLEVKFTKLDSHSKSVIEKVAELRKTGALTPSPGLTIPDLTPAAGSAEPHTPIAIRHGSTEISSSPPAAISEPPKLELDMEPSPPPALAAAPTMPEQEQEQEHEQEQEQEHEQAAAPVTAPDPIPAAEAASPLPAEPVEPPIVDNEPTPFAPPAAMLQGVQLGSELERLRARTASAQPPQGRDDVLERLRQRARQG
jgi:hypothetical protein